MHSVLIVLLISNVNSVENICGSPNLNQEAWGVVVDSDRSDAWPFSDYLEDLVHVSPGALKEEL